MGPMGPKLFVGVRPGVRGKKLMSAPQSIETVTTGADKAKLAAAAVLLLGALVAFYALSKQGPLLQWAALLLLLAALLLPVATLLSTARSLARRSTSRRSRL